MQRGKEWQEEAPAENAIEARSERRVRKYREAAALPVILLLFKATSVGGKLNASVQAQKMICAVERLFFLFLKKINF